MKLSRVALPPFDLSATLFLINIFSLATAFPANAASPRAPTLALPTNLTSPNLTHVTSPIPLKEWPPAPLALKLLAQDPKDFCVLYFTEIGVDDGTPEETQALLWELLDQIDIYNLLPNKDPAKGFDTVIKDVRLVLKPMPRQWVPGDPLSVYLAREAVNQLYGLVLNNAARELNALIECNGVALGRIRVWFDERVKRVSGIS